jgi:hypothetical protein
LLGAEGGKKETEAAELKPKHEGQSAGSMMAQQALPTMKRKAPDGGPVAEKRRKVAAIGAEFGSSSTKKQHSAKTRLVITEVNIEGVDELETLIQGNRKEWTSPVGEPGVMRPPLVDSKRTMGLQLYARSKAFSPPPGFLAVPESGCSWGRGEGQNPPPNIHPAHAPWKFSQQGQQNNSPHQNN